VHVRDGYGQWFWHTMRPLQFETSPKQFPLHDVGPPNVPLNRRHALALANVTSLPTPLARGFRQVAKNDSEKFGTIAPGSEAMFVLSGSDFGELLSSLVSPVSVHGVAFSTSSPVAAFSGDSFVAQPTTKAANTLANSPINTFFICFSYCFLEAERKLTSMYRRRDLGFDDR
jgi:hypothetical protein